MSEAKMETKEYRTVDKSNWTRGEWDNEPDKIQWQDAATGLPCLIVRNRGGALCGYVGVAESHAWFGKNYNDCQPVADDYLDVHGGLTFSDFCADSTDEARHICHVPGPGETDRVWWLGFDCGHGFDVSPGYDFGEPTFFLGQTYKGIGYVKAECAKLAAQIAAVSA